MRNILPDCILITKHSLAAYLLLHTEPEEILPEFQKPVRIRSLLNFYFQLKL